MPTVKRIASFSVDHDEIGRGIYVSRIDGDVTTFDLRTRIPNAGDYMDNLTMHSVEHMFATYIRSSQIGDRVIYFGPMGCQTGFYLLTRDVDPAKVLEIVKETLQKIISHDGEMFGAHRKECGNYRNLNLENAKIECKNYLELLASRDWDFTYGRYDGSKFQEEN